MARVTVEDCIERIPNKIRAGTYRLATCARYPEGRIADHRP